MSEAALTCPFCGFSDEDSYFLTLHIEERHTEDSPFVVRDRSPSPTQVHASAKDSPEDAPSVEEFQDDYEYVECPEADCGEEILLAELNEHLDLHLAEKLNLDGSTAVGKRSRQDDSIETLRKSPHKRPSDRKRESPSSEKIGLGRSILSLGLLPSNAAKIKRTEPQRKGLRLGRAELGPYAWEEQMPKWLYKQLEQGAPTKAVNRIGQNGKLVRYEVVENEVADLLPVIARLCEADESVEAAYLCHPSVKHVFKTPREGGFCGYRNLQMLISYLVEAKAQGHERFRKIPGVLELQDLIEEAWDKGINQLARAQTGGIRGTRKYIGTSEAQAIFQSLSIECEVDTFNNLPDGSHAHELLLAAVERYFRGGSVQDGGKVRKTNLPPIYLQQPGHSLTIIGFERWKNGSCNLLVFDPMFKPSPSIMRQIGRRQGASAQQLGLLRAYRRGQSRLRRHKSFEVLMLVPSLTLSSSWET